MLILFAIIALNLLISWYNAKICGTYWAESKAIGGFPRLLMWCGAIQSAIGFSIALVVVEVLGAASLGYLSPKAVDAAMSLWYLGAILPCIELVIALVLLSLVGGVLITMWLIGLYDRRARLALRGQAMPA